VVQETNRVGVSEDVDERTLFEIYLPPFEGAVKAGLGSVMCSYNKIHDVYSVRELASQSGS
jgi:beta-glucosidase